MGAEITKTRRKIEIVSSNGVRITRALHQAERTVSRKDGECCFTYIKFKKLYPADVTAKLTIDDGRTIERKFTRTKKGRTAFIKKKGNNDDDTQQGDIVIGGLGRCVDVDISIVDTSTANLAIAHYHFLLCCNDAHIRTGTRLTHKEKSITPLGQVVKLPLLEIIDVRRDPCPS